MIKYTKIPTLTFLKKMPVCVLFLKEFSIVGFHILIIMYT